MIARAANVITLRSRRVFFQPLSKFSTRKIAIIGSGPAGYTAAIYAARAMMEPLVLAGPLPGGQLMLTSEIENFPGYPTGVSGAQMMEDLKEQAIHNGAEISHEKVTQLVKNRNSSFDLITSSGSAINCTAVIIASGAQARWLGKSNEDIFKGRGISTCATCDGFFFRGKNVVVVGGGDTAFEEALYLSRLCAQVVVVHRRADFRASRVMQQKVKNSRNISFILNHTVEEWTALEKKDDGQSQTLPSLGGAILKHVDTDELMNVKFDGAFLAVGHTPNSEFLIDSVPLDSSGYIKVHLGQTATLVPGVFACGDVVDKRYRQAITASGMGCMAAMDCEKYVSDLSLII